MSDLTRTDVIKLIAIATKPLNLKNVNLVGVDLSKLAIFFLTFELFAQRFFFVLYFCPKNFI